MRPCLMSRSRGSMTSMLELDCLLWMALRKQTSQARRTVHQQDRHHVGKPEKHARTTNQLSCERVSIWMRRSLPVVILRTDRAALHTIITASAHTTVHLIKTRTNSTIHPAYATVIGTATSRILIVQFIPESLEPFIQFPPPTTIPFLAILSLAHLRRLSRRLAPTTTTTTRPLTSTTLTLLQSSLLSPNLINLGITSTPIDDLVAEDARFGATGIAAFSDFMSTVEVGAANVEAVDV